MLTYEKVKRIYENLPSIIAERNRKEVFTALGYTSDLDILLDFRIERFNELLEQYAPDGILAEMKPVSRIRTRRELVETIVYYCRTGTGGEADIDDPDLLCRNFPHKNGIGGTAVQAALAMAQFGAKSVVHLTDDSREVRELLESPFIRVPLADGSLGRSMDERGKAPPEIHVILQFQKGSVIRLGSQAVGIPWSNRLILTKCTVNDKLPLNEAFLGWVETHAAQVSSNVLSSFNCPLDRDLLRSRLSRIKSHAEAYRRNNPDGIVYFEDGHYHDLPMRKLCMKMLCPYTDILSINEEELACTLEFFGIPVDLRNILSCIEGVEQILKRFSIRRGVVVHTKDYAMYVGDQRGLDIEKGLVFGILLATAKAAFGRYGNDADVRWVLGQPFNEEGLKNQEIIIQNGLEDRVLLVPAYCLDRPKYTIGLGDSFTGGMQLCF